VNMLVGKRASQGGTVGCRAVGAGSGLLVRSALVPCEVLEEGGAWHLGLVWGRSVVRGTCPAFVMANYSLSGLSRDCCMRKA
jgi:hypothetical protein